jgi:hypothetical protein
MTDFHKIWIGQCEAARDIREAFGVQKALGYLIREKFLNFVEAADHDPDFAAEVPAFVEEIHAIFQPEETRVYLDGVHCVGPLGHVCSDEEYEEMLEEFDLTRHFLLRGHERPLPPHHRNRRSR